LNEELLISPDDGLDEDSVACGYAALGSVIFDKNVGLYSASAGNIASCEGLNLEQISQIVMMLPPQDIVSVLGE
jgi:hypothetical protein